MHKYCEINGGKYIVADSNAYRRPSLNYWDGTEIMISVIMGDEDRIDYPVLTYIKRIKRVDDHTITRWVMEFINTADALLYLNEAGLIKVKRIRKFPTGANIVVINDDNIIMDDE